MPSLTIYVAIGRVAVASTHFRLERWNTDLPMVRRWRNAENILSNENIFRFHDLLGNSQENPVPAYAQNATIGTFHC